MPVLYAVKHLLHSWKLFIALLIGITLASTFFAGIDIKANVTVKQAIDQQLSHVYVDMTTDVSSLSLTQMLDVNKEVSKVDDVADTELISGAWGSITLPAQVYPNYSYSVRITGIMNNSHVYDGWLNKPTDELGENETYVSSDASFADKVKVGDIIAVSFNIYSSYQAMPISVVLNLTVKGLADLDDSARSIAMGSYYSWTEYYQPRGIDLLIVDWEKTMHKILDKINLVSSYSSISSTVLIYTDREALISPWDISTSISNVEDLTDRIENVLYSSLLLRVSVQNNLQYTLQSFQFSSIFIRFMFTLVSLPIFFVAWYMGTTVSDVSFNLRRREIGLLLTKGFSRGQILGIFITQTFLLGVIGGSLGVLIGFLVNPLFTQFNIANAFNLNLISPYTLVLTVVFGVVIAFFSTYSSARKASRLATVDALREYLPMEEEKAYKKRLPWLAFILGTYKMVVFGLGINMSSVLGNAIFRSGNFIFMLLIIAFLALDAVLSYLGPLLFFWGFTKLFIQSSLKFQELTTRGAKFLGDLGTLATKNVRRNPARSAKIAFLIALIIGYSVQVTGQLASAQDYAVRNVYYQVGADVAVSISNVSMAPNILNEITANLSASIQDATLEYSFSTSSPVGGTLGIKAVDPNSWRKAAYYEDGWFSGNDANTAFNNLAADNNTIIIDRGIAKPLKLQVSSNITLTLGHVVKTVKIVGFFGVEPSGQQPVFVPEYYAEYRSFVSVGFYESVSDQVSASAKVLVKLKSGVNGKTVAAMIRALEGTAVDGVESFAEEWEATQTDVVAMSTLDVQRLGIVFAFLAASVGTALVSTVSMKERSREATIMSVRGLSYKQLALMFLTENFALVSFSVVLGLVAGVIVTNGNVSSTNAISSSILQHRLVFPLDMGILLFSCTALVFAATILPILIMSREYVTKLERMVRLR